MTHYRVQFRHPGSTPMERKYWYWDVAYNKYLTREKNREAAINESKFWFMLHCMYATRYWRDDPEEYLMEIKEVK